MEGGTAWGNTVKQWIILEDLWHQVCRAGWIETSPKMVKDLCKNGSVISAGSQGHFSSMIVNQMLSSGALEEHVKTQLIPTYHRRYRVMKRALLNHLYKFGVRIEGDKLVEHLHAGSNGAIERDSRTRRDPLVAGGFFLYLTFPSYLPPVEEIAKRAWETYALRIAHGGMGAVAGDLEGYERGANTFRRCARLCWAWQSEEEIEEGIERLAMLLLEMNEDAVDRR